MKEIVYQWVKNLAVFYILLTVVLHLIPDKKYDRYVRHFMGLLLIVMMSAPVFMLLGKSGKIIESFQMNFNQENEKREERRICMKVSELMISPERICCRASEKNYGIFKKLWHRSTGCGSKYRRREIQGSNHSGQRDHRGTERKDCR